jgi:hypothetical protein
VSPQALAVVDLQPYVPAVVGLVAIAGLWFVVRPLVGNFSGWGDMFERYRVDQLPVGERFRSASATLYGGPVRVRYRHVLTVVIAPSGFGVSMMSVFGQAPALFIPWADVQSVAPTREFFMNVAIVRVRDQRPSISLSGPAGAALLQAYRRMRSERSP